MKFRFYLYTLLLSIALVSCGKDDFYYENAFERSYSEWLRFKASSGDSYRYTVTGGTWVGASWETTITVSNGEVIQRFFKMTVNEEWLSEIPEEELEWVEEENQLNSHSDTPAGQTITLDQVYEKARTEWLIRRDNINAYFETDNSGMISTCGYMEKNCADDCFIGINISGIEQL